MKPEKKKKPNTMTLQVISVPLTVCKVRDYSQVYFEMPFTFTGKTDQELSLVCPTEAVPSNTTSREDGWRAFRVAVSMEFSLVGILYRISRILAEAEIGIFAVSTYDTDYVLTKEADFARALKALENAGYTIMGSSPS